jgi:hypothetical protein
MHIVSLNIVKNYFPFFIAALMFLITLNLGIYYAAIIPGLIFLAAALYSPFIAYLTHVFFFYHPLFPFSRTLSGGVALVSFTVFFLIEKKKIILDVTFYLLLAYAGIFSLSGLINGSFLSQEESTFVLFIRFFNVFIYLLVINVISTKNKLRAIINFTIIFAVIQSFLVFAQYLLNFGLSMEYYRPSGSIKDLPETCMMLFFVVPFMIGVTSKTHTIKWKRTVLIMTPFVMLALCITISRAYFISLIILLLIFLFHHVNVRKLGYYTLAIVFVGFFVVAGNSQVIKRSMGLLEIGNLGIWNEATTSMHQRYLSYINFGKVFKAFPIFGIGPGNFYTKSLELGLEPATTESGVNNPFMNLALESGAIGLVLYIIILLYTWKSLVKSQRIAQECNDLEMLYYIRSLKYAFGMGIFALQASGISFGFPIVMSIGLSGAIKQIVSFTTTKE